MRGQRPEASGLAWDGGVPGKATNCGPVAASGAAPKAAEKVLPGQLGQNILSPTLWKEARRLKGVGSHRVPLALPPGTWKAA